MAVPKPVVAGFAPKRPPPDPKVLVVAAFCGWPNSPVPVVAAGVLPNAPVPPPPKVEVPVPPKAPKPVAGFGAPKSPVPVLAVFAAPNAPIQEDK